MAKLGDRQHNLLFEASMAPIVIASLTKLGRRRCIRLVDLGLLRIAARPPFHKLEVTPAGRKALEDHDG